MSDWMDKWQAIYNNALTANRERENWERAQAGGTPDEGTQAYEAWQEYQRQWAGYRRAQQQDLKQRQWEYRDEVQPVMPGSASSQTDWSAWVRALNGERRLAQREWMDEVARANLGRGTQAEQSTRPGAPFEQRLNAQQWLASFPGAGGGPDAGGGEVPPAVTLGPQENPELAAWRRWLKPQWQENPELAAVQARNYPRTLWYSPEKTVGQQALEWFRQSGVGTGLAQLAEPFGRALQRSSEAETRARQQMLKGNLLGAMGETAGGMKNAAGEIAGGYLGLLGKPAEFVERNIVGPVTSQPLSDEKQRILEQTRQNLERTGPSAQAQTLALMLGQAETARQVAALPPDLQSDARDLINRMAYSPPENAQAAIRDWLQQREAMPLKERNALEAKAREQGVTPEELLKRQIVDKHADPWSETILQSVLDPLWLVPAKYANVAFAPINKPFEVAGKVLGQGTGAVMRRIPWLKQAELGKQATVFADRAADAFGEFFGSKAPDEDWVAKFGRALAGDYDASLSAQSRKTLDEILPLFQREFRASTKPNDVGDMLARVWKKYNPAGERILYRDADPAQLAETLKQAAVNAYRRTIGLAPVNTQPGLISRALNWQGSFLKEQWLSNPLFNTAYLLTNTPSDFLRAVATGHWLNPLDVGAAEKVTQLMRGLGLTMPPTIDRTLFRELTGQTAKRTLGATEKIPVPLVGRPSEFAKVVDQLLGTHLRAMPVFNELDTGSNRLALLARNFNLGSLIAHWGTITGGLERHARLTMFYNEVQKQLPELRERVARAILNDGVAPEAVRTEVAGKLRGYQIRTPQDILNLVTEVQRSLPQLRLWDYIPNAAMGEEGTAFLADVGRRLEKMTHVAGRTVTPEQVTAEFEAARRRAAAAVANARRAAAEMERKAEEEATAHAVAATAQAGKDPNLLNRLNEKLAQLRQGYGTVTDGYLRRLEMALTKNPYRDPIGMGVREREKFLAGVPATKTSPKAPDIPPEWKQLDVHNLGEWRPEAKTAYEAWLRERLTGKQIRIPEPIEMGDIAPLVADIQTRAAADWRNLTLGKFPQKASKPGQRTAREVAQALLDADRTLHELTDGRVHLDTSQWTTFAGNAWEALGPRKQINVLLDVGMNPREAQSFVMGQRRFEELPAGVRSAVENQLRGARVAAPAPVVTPADRDAQSRAAWAELIGSPGTRTQSRVRSTDYAAWTDDLLRGIHAALDDWQKQALERLSHVGQSLPGIPLSKADADRWSQMLANEYRRAVDNAAFEVNRLLFDYGSRGGLDKILSALTPFYKYQMNIVPWSIRTMEARPALAALAGRYETASNRDVGQQQLPPRFQGTLPVPRALSQPFMQAWNATLGEVYGKRPEGFQYRIDPKSLLAVVFGVAGDNPEPWLVARGNEVQTPDGDVIKRFGTAEAAQRYVDNQTKGFTEDTAEYVRTLRTLVDGMNALGMRPWPQVQAILYKLGVYGDQTPGDILPWTTAVRAATGARGEPLDLEGALKAWETEGRENQILKFYTTLDLAKRVQAGTLSKEAAQRALADPQSLAYRASERRAQNSIDVKAMQRKLVPVAITGVDPEEMQLRAKAAAQSSLFDALSQAREKNDPADIERAKAAIAQSYAQSPELSIYQGRGKTPQQNQIRADTEALLAANARAKAERDAALAQLPVGYKGPETDRIYGEYHRAVSANERQYPHASFATTSSQSPVEEETRAKNEAIAAILRSEPRYSEGTWKNWDEYQAAYRQWEANLPAEIEKYNRMVETEAYAPAGARTVTTPITRADIEAYRRANDTIAEAVASAYADLNSQRMTSLTAATEPSEARYVEPSQKIVTTRGQALARAQVEAAYGEKPTPDQLVAAVRARYGDRFSEDEIREQIQRAGVWTYQQHAEAGQTPEQRQVSRIFDYLDAVPYGKNSEASAEINRAMAQAGFAGKDYVTLLYDTGGKGLRTDELAALERAVTQVTAEKGWKTKTLEQRKQEAHEQLTTEKMLAERDAILEKYKGVPGHQAELELAQLEARYGRKIYTGAQTEDQALVSRAYAERAKIPPGASAEFYQVLGDNVNRALKRQALANGEKWYGNQSKWYDSSTYYDFDLASLGDKLTPVVEAMEQTSKQLGLKEPSVETLRTWVEAEKAMEAFRATQPANIQEVQSQYYAYRDTGQTGAARLYLAQHPELKLYWDSLAAWQKDPDNKIALWFYYPDKYLAQYGSEPPRRDWAGGPLVIGKSETDKPVTATVAVPRSGAGGGGGGGGGNYVPRGKGSYPMAGTDAQRQIDSLLAGVDGELRELIGSYFRESATSRLLFARQNPRLLWWLSQAAPSLLAQLDRLYQALATPARTRSASYAPRPVMRARY